MSTATEVHGWFDLAFSYATFIECECGFRPSSQEEMDAHIPPIVPPPDTLVAVVAAAIWSATSTFGLARTWEEESLPVRMGFESQARAAIAAMKTAGMEATA